MGKEKKTICQMHDNITYLCGMLEDLDFKQNKMLRRRVIGLVKKIKKVTMRAKQSGQSMENRLSEYRDSIESLGFKKRN